MKKHTVEITEENTNLGLKLQVINTCGGKIIVKKSAILSRSIKCSIDNFNYHKEQVIQALLRSITGYHNFYDIQEAQVLNLERS